MSIWAKLFGQASPAAPRATAQQILSKRGNVARALVSNDANKQLVRGSLERLEAAGLRIRPTLDRDLIVVRFLRSFADRYISEDLVTFFADDKGGGAKCSLDLTVFWELASETDAFDGFEEIDAVLPELSSMSDEVPSDRLDEHSYSVFENAVELSIVNEHGPGEYVRQHVEELADLACGDFEIQSITESDKSDRLVGHVTLSDGRSGSFELSDEKRPDLTPFFKAMNSLVAPLGKGRFLAVLTGSGDDLIAVYLRPGEQIAFRNWAERQFCAGGPAPVDWLE